MTYWLRQGKNWSGEPYPEPGLTGITHSMPLAVCSAVGRTVSSGYFDSVGADQVSPLTVFYSVL